MPRGEEEAPQIESAVPSTPIPRVVPLGKEECEEKIDCSDQGGAGVAWFPGPAMLRVTGARWTTI